MYPYFLFRMKDGWGGGGKIALNKYPSGLVVKNSFRFNFSPFNLLNDVLIQVCKSRISNNIKF